MKDTLRFTVEGMTCGGCARTVRQALAEVPGATPMRVVAGQPVEVEFDDEQADRDAILAAVERSGYLPVLEASA